MAKLTREDLDALHQKVRQPLTRPLIRVGLSSCGAAAGAQHVLQALVAGAKERGFEVDIRGCGCLGMCHAEPLVEILYPGMEPTLYGGIDAASAEWLLDAHVAAQRTVQRYRIPGREQISHAFSSSAAEIGEAVAAGKVKQYRIVLRNCGIIDPEDINDYIGADGYQALKKALFEMTPQQVIDVIKESGLRGRGGAGFPTGLKWQLTRDTPGKEKFAVCNGDEGDPGAYMDRSVLESDPHAVIEGLAIAGYAMGASEGFFYIRAEYPLAVERVENAMRQARRCGLIGKNILGTHFDFNIELRLGAGAFVCGEETALMASVEGWRGTPRPRPPYPSVRGLWDQPTAINNVETLANIAPIVLRGAAWFNSIGTEKSKGTKVFALTGKVKHSGLVEVPMGTSLHDIVIGMGGGTASGKPVKAIQTGGPSGGMIPAEYFSTPVDYGELQKLGSIMGSGGMIVMEEGDSMVDIAKFYLGFCVDESCGKCAPCRIGGKQMLTILERIVAGQGCAEDLAVLRRVSLAMQKASLCGLGQTAPNPVLSSLRYFENEYLRLVAR